MTQLNKEAINEIVSLNNKINEIANLVKQMGITYDSDSWTATLPVNHEYENIMSWNKKNFEKINIKNIDDFILGGNVITFENDYKGRIINEPKILAEAKSKSVKNYIKELLNETNTKYFDIELYIPYKLEDNCGWEQFIGIKAKIKENAKENKSDKMNIECILQALKDKGHIKYYAYGYDTMPMFYRIESKRGEKLGNKILELFSEYNNRGNYIVKSITSTNTKIEFAKIDDLLKWLKQDKFEKNECTIIDWNNSHLDFEFEKFLITNTKFEMKRQKFGEGIEIINTKIRSKKYKLEKQKEQEALDLIDLLL